MEKLPTAEEFLNTKGITGIQANTISNWMIEFAKLHVEVALKEASEKAIVKEGNWPQEKAHIVYVPYNAYPLTNIK